MVHRAALRLFERRKIMDSTNFDQLKEDIVFFENFIGQALEARYSAYPSIVKASFLDNDPVKKWDLLLFFETYKNISVYPNDRLDLVIYNLMDIKLQFFYILEVDLALYNSLVYVDGYDEKKHARNPYILLKRFSLDQSLISKSRILWERIMNLIYYLETGEILELKKSNKKSKRKIFFEFINQTPKWHFIKLYDQTLIEYDNNFRTPEFHRNSVLRAELFGNRENDANKMLGLVNIASNALWENMMAIISGKKLNNVFYIPTGDNDPNNDLIEKLLE